MIGVWLIYGAAVVSALLLMMHYMYERRVRRLMHIHVHTCISLFKPFCAVYAVPYTLQMLQYAIGHMRTQGN